MTSFRGETQWGVTEQMDHFRSPEWFVCSGIYLLLKQVLVCVKQWTTGQEVLHSSPELSIIVLCSTSLGSPCPFQCLVLCLKWLHTAALIKTLYGNLFLMIYSVPWEHFSLQFVCCWRTSSSFPPLETRKLLFDPVQTWGSSLSPSLQFLSPPVLPEHWTPGFSLLRTPYLQSEAVWPWMPGRW